MRIVTTESSHPVVNRYRRNGMYYATVDVGISTAGVVTPDKLYGMPFIPSTKMSLDRLAIKIGTGAVGNARIGVYLDDGTIWPGTLVYGSAALDTSIAVGVEEDVTGLILYPNKLYWFVSLFSSNPTMHMISNTYIQQCLGRLGIDPNCGAIIYEALAYGALPSTAPKTPTIDYSSCPIVYYRAV
jgi:hypothetical protein